VQGGCFRRGRGRDQTGTGSRLSGDDEHYVLRHRYASGRDRRAYERAPDQDHFVGVEATRQLFKKAFAGGRRKKWRLNHSPLYLDSLEGKVDFGCTALAIPSYSMLDDGYVDSHSELVETTDWNAFGRGNDPRCANCMAHGGYEPTSVFAAVGS
jgi:Domain of unknown function (DUF3463)